MAVNTVSTYWILDQIQQKSRGDSRVHLRSEFTFCIFLHAWMCVDRSRRVATGYFSQTDISSYSKTQSSSISVWTEKDVSRTDLFWPVSGSGSGWGSSMGRRLRQRESVRQTQAETGDLAKPLWMDTWVFAGRLQPHTDCWLQAMIGLILAHIMLGLQGQSMYQGCHQRLERLSLRR